MNKLEEAEYKELKRFSEQQSGRSCLIDDMRRRQAAAMRGVGSYTALEQQAQSGCLGQAQAGQAFSPLLSGSIIKDYEEKIKELENYLEFQNQLILDLLNQKNKE